MKYLVEGLYYLKEINRLLKDTKSLLSNGMSNTYLKVTIEKKGRTQNFDFSSLKSWFPGEFLGAPTNAGIIECVMKTSYYNLKIRGLGTKLCVAFLLFLF